MNRMLGIWDEDVLDPEVLLPVQLACLGSNPKAVTPERELMANVLLQAADDLVKNKGSMNRKRMRLHRDAFRWIVATHRRWPYSFVNICDVLGVSDRSVRSELLGQAVTSEAA